MSSGAPFPARVLYDFEAAAEDECAARKGELLDVLEVQGEWWLVRVQSDHARTGILPATYAERIVVEDEPPAVPRVRPTGAPAHHPQPGASRRVRLDGASKSLSPEGGLPEAGRGGNAINIAARVLFCHYSDCGN